MPPSPVHAPLAAGLASPTANATNPTRLAMALSELAQAKAAATASASSSSTSGFAMPPSSQFIGATATGGSRGVVVGVACGIVAIFLAVAVIALTIHVDTGKGRYRRSNRLNRSNRNNRNDQEAGHASVGGVGDTDNAWPVGWIRSLEGKLAGLMDRVRNWRT